MATTLLLQLFVIQQQGRTLAAQRRSKVPTSQPHQVPRPPDYPRAPRPCNNWSMPPHAPNSPQPSSPGTKEQCDAGPSPSEERALVSFVAAALHNDKNSPIYRLPKPVLVQLLKMLDPVSVECLRRTGRRFLQIFDLWYGWPIRRSYPWSTPNLVTSMTAFERETLRPLLVKDAYCFRCQASLRAPDRAQRVAKCISRYLHCSGCRRDHPTCLFTPEQRRAPKNNRLCAGRTGHVRLCQHRVLMWD
ncbi:hypothetical protein QBC35DRAFT_230191 [Podospora australis]|uniref:F-box domain-containing protein n=1 Tax=Podospora australis TaxID=1536484 RepID=A0AAN6WSY9_9PEZI|nr:hypothetical protein QBC35DRAFT_230191 [Podospora australis]